MTDPDPYGLDRFFQAQQEVYPVALDELRRGRKTSHWMWYVFPQFAGLGRSTMAQTYAVRSLEEAKAYVAHPVLGPRLAECCEAVLAVDGRSARDILGTPDDLKLRSCVTLFAAVSPPGSVFERVLAKYYEGNADERTLKMLQTGAG